MLTTVYRKSPQLTGFYHFLTETDEIQSLIDKITPISYKYSSKYTGNNQLVVPCYGGYRAILFLTEYQGLSISLIYLPESGEMAIGQFRFSPEFYTLNTHIYGELWQPKDTAGQTVFSVEAVRMGDNRVAQGLEAFDQFLYTRFKEDYDLEHIKLTIKPFYNSKAEMLVNNPQVVGTIYLNTYLDQQHFIEK